MSFKLCLLLLSLSLSLCHSSNALGHKLQVSIKTDTQLRQMHSESMVLAEQHKDTSTQCFAYFNPQLNQITAQYEINYDNCASNHEKDTKQIEDCYKSTRENLETSASESCRALQKCTSNSDACNAFFCASNNAADDAKIFYAISANATNAAAKSKADFSRVNNNNEACINNAERTYVEDTSFVYGQLNSCLLGNNVIQSPTPPNDDATATTQEDYTTSD